MNEGNRLAHQAHQSRSEGKAHGPGTPQTQAHVAIGEHLLCERKQRRFFRADKKGQSVVTEELCLVCDLCVPAEGMLPSCHVFLDMKDMPRRLKLSSPDSYNRNHCLP